MNDERMELGQAREIVGRLAELLRDTCDRVEVAGSIRRGKATVKDAELVVIGGFQSHRNGNKRRERLWLSPGCVGVKAVAAEQMAMWG